MYYNAIGSAMPATGATTNWTITGSSGGQRTGSNGNDMFHSLKGDTLVGGLGSDTYNLWDPTSTAVEAANAGIDTVYARFWGGAALADNIENLYLMSGGSTWGTGNALGNLIVAGSVGATLNGLGGDDVLVGGAGADVFKIKAGNGSDAIVNFKKGWDVVSLEGYGITSFAALQGKATQAGADVKVQLSTSEILVMRDIKLSDLTASDFNLPMAAATKLSDTVTVDKAGGGWNNNGWYVLNNTWGLGNLVLGKDATATTQFRMADMTAGTTFDWSMPLTTQAYAPILSYQEVMFGLNPKNPTGFNPTDTKQVFPLKVGDLTSLIAKQDVTFTGTLSGFNVAYDIWFTKTKGGGEADISNELMIWVHKGAFEAFGKLVGTYTSPQGYTAKIYHTGTYTAVVFDQDQAKLDLDVAHVIKAVQALGIISSNEWLGSVELGAEVVSGTGRLVINNLDLDVTTRNADGSLTTKLVTGSGTTVTTSSPVTTVTQPVSESITQPVSSGSTETSTSQSGTTSTTAPATTDATTPVTTENTAPTTPTLTKQTVVNADGSTLVTTFDATGAIVGIDKTIVNSNGTTTIQHLDAKSVLQSWDVVKVAGSSTTTYHYDAKGVLQDINVDRIETGNLIKSIDYDGNWNVEGATFTGTALNDTMAGATYNTEYHGGLGSDRINGGSGVDTIHFDTAIGKGDVDSIRSFLSGKDKLVLDNDIFSALKSTGPLSSAEFVIGTKATTAEQHLIYDRTTGNLYYDADGSGSQAAVLFANFEAWRTVTASDFVIA